jgi:MOSC domain-containing protein YiiM
MPSLVAACTVRELRQDAGYFGVTAIDKAPVTGAIKVTKYGLRGDVQADRKHHGGLDKALYAYSSTDAEYWEEQLGRNLGPGWFGENLRLDGIDVNNARIGERWQIGEQVIVEVMMPRTPCQTFARWVGGDDERGWVKRFSDERRLGAYLSVVKTGTIRAGDAVSVVHRPDTTDTVVSVYSFPE